MNIEKYRCIAVVGGGGKTSLIYYLARLFIKQKRKVIIATSTHMVKDNSHPFALWGDKSKIRESLLKACYCVTGIPEENTGKITCPKEADWRELLSLCDVLLIEADGAKGLPLKVPADHEPVIPDAAELVIGVAGLDVLDKPIKDVCHRPELTAEFLGVDTSHLVTEEDIAEICCSSRGLRKGVGNRDFKVFLNKADTSDSRKRGFYIRDMILKNLSGQMEIETEVDSLQRKDIAIVLLAAGNSKRFGKENKLLYKLNGKTLFEHTLHTVLDLKCGSVTVVTQYKEIEEICENRGVQVLYNHMPDRGISSSVKIGIEGNRDAKAWLICVCDQPYMRKETVEGLINCYFLSGKGIAALLSGGKIVNPAVFSYKYGEELLKLEGDTGGKTIIKAHGSDVALYEVLDKEELRDIDYPIKS